MNTLNPPPWKSTRLRMGLPILILTAGCMANPKQNQTRIVDRNQTRIIDFALWSGVPNAHFGDRIDKIQGSRRIHGPIPWTHPITKEKLSVYARVNTEKDGEKLQYFTLRSDGTALARVYDKRPGQSDRVFVDDAFFPLGPWKNHQTRRYISTEYQDGLAAKRNLSLQANQLRFNYQGKPDSFRYEWVSETDTGKMLFHERYTYSPGIGFVKFSNRRLP